ncbi:hypothetical protein PPYR_00172 [Photinus pyralis]|uniref:Transcriptional regulator ATRX n=2 Tax=Photinus pyralis TaxID=7054 RepID=A0A5N4B0T3_PHOPY|nr:transcriptional regulator ATRX homolog [Photinus pyralis]XP_031330247.1 transcriptional regulator ATRX homolog [Photinus pyralis]KAB0803202.1 hypothetical protein PPYR_00172 [Photinus pyralis]
MNDTLNSSSDLEDTLEVHRKRKMPVFSASDSDEMEFSGLHSSSSSYHSSDSEIELEKELWDNKIPKKLPQKRQYKRKAIRKVIDNDSLTESTKKAEKAEKERKARILEREIKYNEVFSLPLDGCLEKVVLDFDGEKELLSVNEVIAKKLKPHQGKGIQFMWDTCFETVERATSTTGSGCILAHCMGLGKTLQVIAFTHTLLTNDEVTNVRNVLVVCPLNTVLNWESEYQRWLSDVKGPRLNIYQLVSSKTNPARERVVQDWNKKGGVLIIGYEMFRNLSNPTNQRLKKKSKECFQKCLVDPGPDLVVCDEGHLLKNEKSNLSIAMNRIRSPRRIVLTGTPMQNNLKEYFCMVQFVKPHLLGTYKEYRNRFVNPITNGQYTDSTPQDIDLMKKRSHVLHTMLDGIVQRRDYSVLAPYLPPKYEYVLFLRLSPIQIKLYGHYRNNYSQVTSESSLSSTYLFKDFHDFQRICTHPQVLLMRSRKEPYEMVGANEDSESSLIDDEPSPSTSSNNSENDSKNKPKIVKKPKKRTTRNSAASTGIGVESTNQPQWWNKYCKPDDFEQIDLSAKLYLLFKIIEECQAMGEKLLVFSQSLLSLDVIEYFLAKINTATREGDNSKVCDFSGSWTLGHDYFRLDGQSSCDNRIRDCNIFNNKDNARARLFLISTRAGGLGINLVGANRVVIFDVSWNPAHDVQSIYRIYRFGQTKPCYVYRFVMYGTMEMKIYERQVTKQAISKRVIDEQQIDRHYNQDELAELYMFDPEPTDTVIPLVPKDKLLGELLQMESDRIYKYHEHQSLLENIEVEELNEAERKAAWEEFEREKLDLPAIDTSSLEWINTVPVPRIRVALKNIIQRDNPYWTQEEVLSAIPLIVKQLQTQAQKLYGH